MRQVTLDLSEEEEALLSARAQRLGTSVDRLASEALRKSLQTFAGLPKLPGPIQVPPDFDWTKNSSWFELIERYEAEEGAAQERASQEGAEE